MGDSDLAGQLRELAELNAAGALDDDELALARQRVLGGAAVARAPAASGDAPALHGSAATGRYAIGPTGAMPPGTPLAAHLIRIIRIGGYEMPLAVPVVAAAVLVLFVLVVALASIR